MFRVGRELTATAWLDDDRMYLADFGGRLRLLNVETGKVTTVRTGLSMPQGLTVLDGRLYVSDMGNVCRLIEEMTGGTESGCKYSLTDLEARVDFFSRVSARILSYSIDDSGGLGDRQIVVDKIISSDITHGPNGLANDGEYVYVSIGYPWFATGGGFFVYYSDELAAHHRRTDLMGTVARFSPPHNEVDVYASGFRNVYGISIAPDGTIYGADNDDDGSGEHLEELNAIVEGGFYGYPLWGTNEAPQEADVTEPVAVLQGIASTYAYANDDGVYVAYQAIDDEGSAVGFVIDRFGYDTWMPERIFKSDSYVTSILERDGLLYAASFSGNVHVIDPSAAPVSARPFGPFHNDAYMNKVIASGGPSVISSGGGYDVYIDDGRLAYARAPCSQSDTTDRFFLHVVPVDPNDLPEGRRRYGFDNLDFPFDFYGWRSGDSCFAVRELPEYPISIVRTGQSVREGTDYRDIWKAEHRFER